MDRWYEAAQLLTSTSIPVVLNVDVDGILEVSTELFGFLLKQSIPGNNCLTVSKAPGPDAPKGVWSGL